MKKNIFTSLLLLLTLLVNAQVSNYDSHIKNGLNYYNKGLTQQAMNEFQQAHSIDSNRVEAYYYTGVTIASICQQSGNSCVGAIEMLTTSINIDPTYRNSYYNRGVCFLRINMLQEAISDFDKAIELDPTNGECFTNRAIAKFNLNLNDSGCEDLKKALDLGATQAKSLKSKYCN
jgi:tetratricopeptide (TPR) repeat protein